MDVALLHGAWCGSWVWAAVEAELAARGVTVKAVDLPGESAMAGVGDHVATARAALPRGGARLVVGHSLAGILLEPLAAVLPVDRLLYLTAFVPSDGRSLRDQWRTHPELLRDGWSHGLVADHQRRTAWADLEVARRVLFADCDEKVAAKAVTSLRPQGWKLSFDVHHGRCRTPSMVVVADEDRLLGSPCLLDAAAAMIEEPVLAHIDGGHMPMSSRPERVAQLIAEYLETAG